MPRSLRCLLLVFLGGNWNNRGNDGLFYFNANNGFGNANVNYGFRNS